MKSKRWIWIVVFVTGLLVILGLMTGWNLSFFHDYQTLLKNSEKFRIDTSQFSPFLSISLAILTALSVLSVMIVFFIRLLREMQLSQLQEEFISSVTHEFRTPIAAMELSASLLREDWNQRRQSLRKAGADTLGMTSDEDIQRLWQSHDEELQRLKREVEILLTATRLEGQKNRKAHRHTAVHLEEWLTRSLARWQKLMPNSAVIARTGAKLDLSMQLDVRSLDLIFDNLLDNVRKYAITSPALSITTELTAEGAWSIEFKDQGIGFDPRESEKIFKRFHRAHVEDKIPEKKKIPGVGLGLFIARSAAKQMGLTLSAWSPGIGRGCTFTLADTSPRRRHRVR